MRGGDYEIRAERQSSVPPPDAAPLRLTCTGVGTNTAALPAVTEKLPFAPPFMFSPSAQNTDTAFALSLIIHTMPLASLLLMEGITREAPTVALAMTRGHAGLPPGP